MLCTERLVLRPVTGDDHPALLAHWTLPDVRRFLFDGAPLSSAEDSGAPSNRNRRTSGSVQWASSAGWSSPVTGRSTRRSVHSMWSTPPDYPAGHRAARLPGTALACG